MPRTTKTKKVSPQELEKKFEETAFRMIQEKSDFFLPQILDFVKQKQWINLRPEYQRRLVWDNKKRSLFIESLLLNIPVPPIFLFEQELSRYEVMDGQQRINAVTEFLDNGYELTGLDRWKELKGLRYRELPEKIKRGLDRRRLAANVLVVESSFSDDVQKDDIRRLVFERLNTGGLQLNAQELRNCLYSGRFNDAIIDLARNQLFCKIWEIPQYDKNIDAANNPSKTLAENSLYKRMNDCELVLRYFAFRKSPKGSVKRMLDNFMKENRNMNPSKVESEKGEFLNLLELANKIFGENTFRYKAEDGQRKLSAPLYDAVMVGLHGLASNRDQLISSKSSIQRELDKVMKDNESQEVILGKPNTAKAITNRQQMVLNAIKKGARL